MKKDEYNGDCDVHIGNSIGGVASIFLRLDSLEQGRGSNWLKESKNKFIDNEIEMLIRIKTTKLESNSIVP
jgi:hypothetical protein